jgi:hypothetical protein
LNPRPHKAQLEDPKNKKNSRMSFRRTTVKANKKQEKRQSQAKWQERAKKSSEEQEKLKINTKAQNQHSP